MAKPKPKKPRSLAEEKIARDARWDHLHAVGRARASVWTTKDELLLELRIAVAERESLIAAEAQYADDPVLQEKLGEHLLVRSATVRHLRRWLARLEKAEVRNAR